MKKHQNATMATGGKMTGSGARAWPRWKLPFLAGVLLAALLMASVASAKYLQMDVVADVKTRYSAGCSAVSELAETARGRGIDAVVFSDSDRYSLEYGLAPLERILKKRVERKSVLTAGSMGYLAAIYGAAKNVPEVVLIPAVESAPFYYWTGSPAKKDLVAHNWDKHLLVMGLENPVDYDQLPTLDSNLSGRYVKKLLPRFAPYAGLTLLCLIFVFRGNWRKTAFLFTLAFGLLAGNNHPLRSSPFDQYSGDKGMAPYQELIDYATAKGALVFWNHLESTSAGQYDLAGLQTPSHPGDLIASQGYTGFEAVYDAPAEITDAGKEWDQVLIEYLNGKRAAPVWGYGGNNFLCEDDTGVTFGAVRTIALVKEKKREAIIDAFRAGRTYATRQMADPRLSLDEFSLFDKTSGQEATLGETLMSADAPEIRIKLRRTKGAEGTVVLSVIRDGQMIKQETVSMPYELTWRDIEAAKTGKHYYRLLAKMDAKNYLVSNPVFVQYAQPGEQVALAPSVALPAGTEAPLAPAPPREPQAGEAKPPKAPTAASPAGDKPPVDGSLLDLLDKGGAAKPADVAAPQVREPQPPKAPEPPAAKEVRAEPPPAPKKEPAAPPAPPAPPGGEGKYVVALIDGLTLKKGPGPNFAEAGAAQKGERLLLVRKMPAEFNGKPWLEVKKGNRTYYVWEGLVKHE